MIYIYIVYIDRKVQLSKKNGLFGEFRKYGPHCIYVYELDFPNPASAATVGFPIPATPFEELPALADASMRENQDTARDILVTDLVITSEPML